MKSEEFNRLLRRIKTKSAFDRIFRFYFPKIVIHIYVKYKDRSLSEDVAQEFFLKLLKMNVDYFIESPNSWVYTIAENIAKNILVKEKRNIQEPIDNVVIQYNDVYDSELYGEYSEKLKQLNDESREIIILRLWEGFSFKEIAVLKKMKAGTVRQKYSRGIKKLKKL